MAIILAFMKKEFLQVIRNKFMIFILIAAPFVQLVILVFAANPIMKNIQMDVVDHDQSVTSQNLVNKIRSSGYFQFHGYTASYKEAAGVMQSGKSDLIIEFPSHFEADMINGERPKISFTINAVNSMKAGLISSYLSTILRDAIKDIAAESAQSQQAVSRFNVTYSMWYNERMDHKTIMLPGILALLITVISIMLSSLNLVREKEMGTIEQINVTPISKAQLILGKLLPYTLIGLLQFTLGLIVINFLFRIHVQGSLLTIYFIALIYVAAVQGIGLFISTISDSQSQAMFISMFFIFIFVLMSGLFTPIDSMPEWARTINSINPVAYIVEIIRLVILKGSTLEDVKNQTIIIAVMAIVTNIFAILNYRKTN